MKKKEITLETIANSIDLLAIDMREIKTNIKVLKEDVMVLKVDVCELKKDVSKLQENVGLIKLDISQLRKDVNRMDENLLDTQEGVRIILELAKGNDGRLGYFQIATAH